ncbi:Tyrosine recombinase XerC [Anaerolineae bacterium]|nr:Tyrosine recombinase XerC [Anaerolineae bacterium]
MMAFTTSAAERYDTALHRARKSRLPENYPLPRPSAEWPPENVTFLEDYRTWLFEGGLSRDVIQHLYIPTVGHVLGLALKPYAQLDLEVDLERVMAYLKAKRSSAEWLHNSGIALEKFRQFLRQQRGQMSLTLRPQGREWYVAGLPDWLVEQLDRYCHLMQSHWRPARVKQRSQAYWSAHTAIWRWVCERRVIASPLDVKRQDLLDYIDHCLVARLAASTINGHLRSLHAFLLYLQEQDFRIPQALLRVPFLKEPDRLPRFLTDEQVRQVRDDFEQRVTDARFAAQRRDALLDRAAFYLMWHGGLRLGEVEELRLGDLDLLNRKVMVRQGKGRKDRAIYLTDTAVQAVREYLTVRGEGADDHVFLYRHRPLAKELIWARTRAAGERVGVKVTPHQLRHTCATQLLNAGCKITSIQQLLGHREIGSTLIYARIHDETVASDYYVAMARLEKSLEIPAKMGDVKEPNNDKPVARAQLLVLIDQLAVPQLGLETRLDLVAQMRHLLNGQTPQLTLSAVC